MIRKGMNVTVKGYRGVAFYVRKAREGRTQVVMVGDDRVWDVPVTDCTALGRKNFCGVCGQVGCGYGAAT